ncbi:MAG: methylamine dehydrogenase accessory protein MauD [Gammaproteobacteria bacterium RIFCSPLOWO2_02_FULL_61_13]|nr:MAG: methylamine dehydrogenase accessory protein MauD [Gammaproteobacteria bacterium RIFCSPLOWO2_02_FULL_61_13]
MADALIISNLLLWVVVIAMGLVILALVRQVGVLYERVAPAGALMVNKKVKAGELAPELTVVDLSGKPVAIGGVSNAGRSTLLFFLSPSCPICKTLLPVIRSAARSERNWVDVILASDGKEQDHRKFVAEHDLGQFPYVSSEILGLTYGVGKLPYAVLIGEQGNIVSMGIINSREHLESLFESKEQGVASIQEYLHTRIQRSEAGGK